MEIRSIGRKDYREVEQLIRQSFSRSEHGYDNEAELVEKIRTDCSYVDGLEVVAAEGEKIIGYGLLSEVEIINDKESFTWLVLAPLAVLPSWQGKKVGENLLKELEKRAVQQDFPFISILGHPQYYSRFGYVSAEKYKVTAPFDVPAEAFMIRPLQPNALKNISGCIKYAQAFDV